MEWLEQNIDAYRIVSEVLGQLRTAIREGLERLYGEEWYRKGLPQEVFDRLVAAKEREKSIDWYEDQYQEIMEYVTFPDLVEILQMNAKHFPEFIALAPSESLLNARFLELDVMRAKLGRARPISETELSFLGTFHIRFRKAVEESRNNALAKADDQSVPSEAEEESTVAIGGLEPIPETESTEDGDVFTNKGAFGEAPSIQPPPPKKEDGGPSPPIRPVQTSVGSAGTAAGGSAASADGPEHGHFREYTPPEGIRPDGSVDGAGQQPFPDEPSSGVIARPDRATKAVGPKKLRQALANNDHLTVLRELYREVTAIAEGVWSSEVTPTAMVWDQVTASDWYEMNFSRLGLQPLSVFYEVTDKVDKKVRSGADKPELEEFLKETNFAKTLLALRDMFQANNI
jgi:hypothetical protein